MGKRLTDNINSHYFEAANKMTSKKARRKIIAYVESYDDIFFWRSVLSRFEDETREFEVMLPTRSRYLDRGKKAAITNMIRGVGKDMIACVDADYDYLMQGETEMSKLMLESPYVFHTYAYAIENYQCYAKGLHDTCVMVTLNDHDIFDFEAFMDAYSQTIFPLFVWHVAFLHRRKMLMHFDMSAFNQVVSLPSVHIQNPNSSIHYLEKKVRAKILQLAKHFPKVAAEIDKEESRLRSQGVNEHNAYLFVQGHHLFNQVVYPMVQSVCDKLIHERETTIRNTSIHLEQAKTELSCYDNSLGSVKMMMKKNTYYQFSPLFQKILDDLTAYLRRP